MTQLTEASQRGGPLSFEDKICLVLARDNGWVCITNDSPLRNACKTQGVAVIWGLEIMLLLVENGHLSVARAIEVAEAIHWVNPLYITSKIVDAFRQKLAKKSQHADDSPGNFGE